MLLCSHSPNDPPPPPPPTHTPRTSAERIHSRGTGRRASVQDTQDSPQIYINYFARGPEILNVELILTQVIIV